MRRALIVAIALGLTTAAFAQTPAPLQAPGPELQSKDMKRYCGRRSNRVGNVYPRSMVEKGKPGFAEWDCLVDELGTPVSCVILSEEPRGRGFGEAALKLGCRMRIDVAALSQMDAQSAAEQSVYRTDAGWRVRIKTPFRVED